MTVGQIIDWVFGRDEMPSFEDAERAVREAEMPWTSEDAFAEFARCPEVQGEGAREHA